jgi:hypothetical protein
MFLEVILENSLKSKNLGCYSGTLIVAGQRTAWAPANRRGRWPASRCVTVASCCFAWPPALDVFEWAASSIKHRAAVFFFLFLCFFAVVAA